MRWQRSTSRRFAVSAIAYGRCCHVEQTVRSERAHGVIGQEFQASVSGVRLGEFETVEAAQRAAIAAAKKKPRRRSAGVE